MTLRALPAPINSGQVERAPNLRELRLRGSAVPDVLQERELQLEVKAAKKERAKAAAKATAVVPAVTSPKDRPARQVARWGKN